MRRWRIQGITLTSDITFETDNRPEISQFMHSATSLQDGGSVHAAQYHRSGMGYGKIRPKKTHTGVLCLLRQISPHAEYLVGKENVLTDWESRHHNSSDWQLLPSVFEAVNHLLGPFTIDLFMSRMNAQLPVYCSWRPNLQGRVVDTFSTSWSQDHPYLSLLST